MTTVTVLWTISELIFGTVHVTYLAVILNGNKGICDYKWVQNSRKLHVLDMFYYVVRITEMIMIIGLLTTSTILTLCILNKNVRRADFKK